MSASESPRLVFFGTPPFAAKLLAAMVDAGFDVVAVVCGPDRPIGRGRQPARPAVAAEAERHGLLTLQPESLKHGQVEPMLAALGASVAVLAAYGKMIPPSLLSLFAHGIVNVHPSLLPRHRGASPIQSAILSGDATTGVSLMLLDEQLDHGPIIAQEECPVGLDDTAPALGERLATLASKLLVDTLPRYLVGSAAPVPQNHDSATYCPKISKADGLANWNQPPEALQRQWRAFQPWPGFYTYFGGKVLKLGRLEALRQPPNTPIGHAFLLQESRRFGVACSGGAVIPEAAQLEGGSSVPNDAFLRGHPGLIGAKLGR